MIDLIRCMKAFQKAHKHCGTMQDYNYHYYIILLMLNLYVYKRLGCHCNLFHNSFTCTAEYLCMYICTFLHIAVT